MQPIGRPRLTDVAARAGVSLKTASRALNHEYGVAPATAARVLRAAEELGFRPNRLAQSLAGGGHSALVGLLIPDVADPFVAEVAGGVEDVLAERGMQLISASHRNDPELQRRLVTALTEHRVAALILMPAPGPADYLAPDLTHGLVVAALDRPLDGPEVDTVTVDNEAGTDEAIARLIAAGHRRIAVLALDARLWTIARRIEAWRAALLRAGLPSDDRFVVTDPDPVVARRALVALIQGPDAPTAVLALSHGAGRAAMRAVRDAGRPVDLAVFDSMGDNDLLGSAPLVVVVSGPDRMGRLAAELVVDRLGGMDVPPLRMVLPPVILERGAPGALVAAGAADRPTPPRAARPSSAAPEAVA